MLESWARTAALGVVAFAVAHVGGVATGGPAGPGLIGAAEAHYYKGSRIHRIKIRKRRVGSGFKVVPTTEGDSSSGLAKLDVVISDAATNEVVEALSLATPSRARVRLHDHEGPAAAGPRTFFITAEVIDGAGAPTGELTTTEVVVELEDTGDGRLFGEAVSADGWKLRARTNAAGELVTVLLNANKGWRGDGVSDVSWVDEAGEPRPLDAWSVRQRWVGRTGADLSLTPQVWVESFAYDADGALVDSRVELVTIDPDAAEPALGLIKVAATKGGDAKIVTVTDSGGEDMALAVELRDAETGEVALTTVDDTPILSQRYYYTALPIEFDAGAEVAGAPYLVLIDLLDTSGDPTGVQSEVELVAPAPPAEGEAFTSEPVSFSWRGDGDDDATASLVANAEGYYLYVGLEGDDAGQVAAIGFSFEEPFEGPSPLETETEGVLQLQRDKWVQRGADSVPDAYALDVTLMTPEGGLLGAFSGQGSDAGVAYKTDPPWGGIVPMGGIPRPPPVPPPVRPPPPPPPTGS